MRRLNPVMTLTTALLTAAAAASPESALAGQQQQGTPRPAARSTPAAPEALGASDPMASARSPRHLLRNGQDYLKYGEHLRALTLFREAEARSGELTEAERKELQDGIDAARTGMRSPEATDPTPVSSRRTPARARTGALPGAIALADPPRAPAEPSPFGPSTDGVLLTGGEQQAGPPPARTPAPAPAMDLVPPVPPEPIAIDPRVLPSVARQDPSPAPAPAPPAPAAADARPVFGASAASGAPTEPPPLPPVASAPAPASGLPPLPVEATPTAFQQGNPDQQPSPAADTLLPPLPVDEQAGSPPAQQRPSEMLGAAMAEPSRSPAGPHAPPDELPALPPSAEDLMELGSRASTPPSPSPDQAPAMSPTPTSSPSTFGDRSGLSTSDAASILRDTGPRRDLLTPEQREEIMMIVRRQEEADREGFVPAPLDGDPMSPSYEDERMSGSAINLPRPPSPSEIRPIQSIPIADDFVPLPTRRFNPSRKYWSAAATCHGPLYFQDPVLERYGQSVEQKLGPIGRFLSYPLDDPTQSQQRNQIAQPFFSGALMAAQIVTWPYKAIVDPPGEAEYDLGYYRPGDLVPPDLIYVPVHGVGPAGRGKHY